MATNNIKNSNTNETLTTSPTLRAKDEKVKRLFIAICKVFRMCKKTKKKQ